jgi:predicted RNase H-like nuclease (RuvC/YqgF family)
MSSLRKITKDKQEHELKLTQMKVQNNLNQPDTPTSDIEALRHEMAELRKTTSEYDLSIQHLLENLEKRMSYLESENIRSRYANQSQDDLRSQSAINRSDIS